MPKRAAEKEPFVPRKRAMDDNIPAGMKLKHDVDAMGCLILTVTKDNRDLHEKLTNLRGENETLKATVKRAERDLRRTESYVTELECRMEALEAVIKRTLLHSKETVGISVLGVMHDVYQDGDHCRDDIERLVEEVGLTEDFDILEGWTDWLDDPVTESMFE